MNDIPIFVNQSSVKFIDQIRLCMRARRLAYATEKTYVAWVLRFIRFHNKRHPKKMGTTEVAAFLSHLSVERHCSKATQRTALDAIIFLFKQFIQREDVGQLNYVCSLKSRLNF